jgi:hypothetical protein
MLPGTTVTVRESSPPRSAPTDASVFFAVGFADRGPLQAKLIQSIAELESVFGDRVSWGVLYDAVDVFFREGGSKAYIGRVVGPTPVKATANVYDETGSTTGDVALAATAVDYGTWGNDLVVDILAGDTDAFKVQVTLDGTVVETSDDLADPAAAVEWASTSSYIRLTLGVSEEDPRVQTVALTGGTDDHTNATDTEWDAALDLFGPELGPGQVAMPGRTTDTAHQNLLAHAAANNRRALIDLADTYTVATLTTAAAAARSDGDKGAAFAPWALVPGIAGGSTRTVPYSAVEAGIIARNDSAGLSPNVPAANLNGVARYAIGLSQPEWSKADRATLNGAGVNVARIMNGDLKTYGYRTLASPTGSQLDLEFSNSRLVMEIVARLEAVGDRYVFAQIDGRGFTLGDFASDLAAELTPYYNAGSLYGSTQAEAFSIDVGPQINPPDQLEQGVLSAQVNVRLAPFAEQVPIFITKRSITEEVA